MQGISFGSSGFKLSWQPSQLALQHMVRLRRAGIWHVSGCWWPSKQQSPVHLIYSLDAKQAERKKKKMKGEKKQSKGDGNISRESFNGL